MCPLPSSSSLQYDGALDSFDPRWLACRLCVHVHVCPLCFTRLFVFFFFVRLATQVSTCEANQSRSLPLSHGCGAWRLRRHKWTRKAAPHVRAAWVYWRGGCLSSVFALGSQPLPRTFCMIVMSAIIPLYPCCLQDTPHVISPTCYPLTFSLYGHCTHTASTTTTFSSLCRAHRHVRGWPSPPPLSASP